MFDLDSSTEHKWCLQFFIGSNENLIAELAHPVQGEILQSKPGVCDMDKLTHHTLTGRTDLLLRKDETCSQWKKNCRIAKQEGKGTVMKLDTADFFTVECIV